MGRRLKLGISGGIAIFPVHARNGADLLRAADAALYQAKKYQPRHIPGGTRRYRVHWQPPDLEANSIRLILWGL